MIGDYFEEYWSAVYSFSNHVTVITVLTLSKVEVLSESGTETLITRRVDGIWRKEGQKKEIGQGREIGTRYNYMGKIEPKKTNTHPIMW